MRFFPAFKAVRLSTEAVHDILIGIVKLIRSIIAVSKGTPPDHRVVIGVRLAVIPLISLHQGRVRRLEYGHE